MLDLKSPRWKSLLSHLPQDEFAPVAECVAEWKKSLGTRSAPDKYEELRNQYLHQKTIVSCAYAVIPHVVDALKNLEAEDQIFLLRDVMEVEMRRCSQQEHDEAVARAQGSEEFAKIGGPLRDILLKSVEERNPVLPEDLAKDYFQAVSEAKKTAVALFDQSLEPKLFLELLGIVGGLHRRDQYSLINKIFELKIDSKKGDAQLAAPIDAIIGLRFEEDVKATGLLGISFPPAQRIDEKNQIILRDQGFRIVLNEQGLVSEVQLHAKGHEGFEAFTGEVSEGVQIGASFDDVRDQMGEPNESGRPPRAWDKYKVMGTGIRYDYDAASLRVIKITLTYEL